MLTIVSCPFWHPWWLNDKNPPANIGDVGLIPGLGRYPLEKEMAIHSSILAWEIHGQRSLVGYSPWGRKRVRLSG